MRVYVVPSQVPRFNGFAAFNGESAESHCARVYADCPELQAKCLKCIGITNPFTGECLGVKPYTVAGKKLRGLPDNYQPGQCPSAQPAPAPNPPQVPYNPPPPQVPQGNLPVPPSGAVPGGTVPNFPTQEPGIVDQLLANKPLLIGGGAAIAFFAWQALQRRGGARGMNGYRQGRKAKRVH